MTNKTQNDLATAREDRDFRIRYAKQQADREFVEKVYQIKERDGVTKTAAIEATGMSRQAFWDIERLLKSHGVHPFAHRADSS